MDAFEHTTKIYYIANTRVVTSTTIVLTIELQRSLWILIRSASGPVSFNIGSGRPRHPTTMLASSPTMLDTCYTIHEYYYIDIGDLPVVYRWLTDSAPRSASASARSLSASYYHRS